MANIKQTENTIANLLQLLEEKRKLRNNLDFEIQTLSNARDKLKKYKRTLR